MNYQNFDLELISSQGNHQLYARVLDSPQGDSPFVGVTWPFDADEENAFLTEIYGGLRQRRARSLKMPTIQDFGGRLFDAVFTGDIEHLFRSSLDAAFKAGKGLRLRLRLPDDSALHARPWEFLFDTECREFLAVREHTPLVRYLPVAQPLSPISVEGPVRILVALAAPTDHPRLDVSREWEILESALRTQRAAGKVELRSVDHCTFDNLRDSLRHFGTHIFHFIGHGIPGALVLEQESGKGVEMEASQLRSAFPGGMLPRLIILNSCSSAIGEDVPFSGLAQGFLRQGVPAVVAMQASITDDAALIFTRYFYRDLIETGAVDTSLTEARLRMKGNGHPIEWGTPVLYMRAMNGQLFQPGANLGEGRTQPEPLATGSAPPGPGPGAGDRKRHRQIPPGPASVKPEAGPGERKRPAQKKDSPPQPAPGIVDGKRSRENLAKEHVQPTKPELRPDQPAPPRLEPVLDQSPMDWRVDDKAPRIDDARAAPERLAKPVAAAVPTPAPQPVVEIVSKPVVDLMPKPAVEPAPPPGAQGVAKPVMEPASKPASHVPPRRPVGMPAAPRMDGPRVGEPPGPAIDMPPVDADAPGRRPPWVLPLAGLLAASLAVAAASMFLRGRSVPAPDKPTPMSAPSADLSSSAAPASTPVAPASGPDATAKAEAGPSETKPAEPAAPVPDKTMADAKLSASSTRKHATPATRKPPASAGIDCRNPEVAERRIECLLRK